LIELVTQLITCKKTKPSSYKIEKEIDELQNQIDQIIYRLYDTLTVEDIKIVEETKLK
jgi:hypothetical protein